MVTVSRGGEFQEAAKGSTQWERGPRTVIIVAIYIVFFDNDNLMGRCYYSPHWTEKGINWDRPSKAQGCNPWAILLHNCQGKSWEIWRQLYHSISSMSTDLTFTFLSFMSFSANWGDWSRSSLALTSYESLIKVEWKRYVHERQWMKHLAIREQGDLAKKIRMLNVLYSHFSSNKSRLWHTQSIIAKLYFLSIHLS